MPPTSRMSSRPPRSAGIWSSSWPDRRRWPAMDERLRYSQGMTVRREVLGDTHVNRSERHRNAFNEEFQDLITRYAWGEIWTRPGLSRQTRSCMTLSMTLALGHWDEFKLHVQAAF